MKYIKSEEDEITKIKNRFLNKINPDDTSTNYNNQPVEHRENRRSRRAKKKK